MSGQQRAPGALGRRPRAPVSAISVPEGKREVTEYSLTDAPTEEETTSKEPGLAASRGEDRVGSITPVSRNPG